MDSLGDRIKGYEQVSRHKLVKRVPVIVRVDGRAFHSLDRDKTVPFDRSLQRAMVHAAAELALEMQGFKLAYVQSDEASFLLTDYDRIESDGWFGYDLNKILSISAATMSVSFTTSYGTKAVFDSRAFNVPESDVANVFLWRALDWHRNSLQMYARHYFSHNALHGKETADIHEMLRGSGLNWTTDVPPASKNGTFLYRPRKTGGTPLIADGNVLPIYADIKALVDATLAGE